MKIHILKTLKGLLKEKTALPVVFLIIATIANYLIVNDFFKSENKLRLTLANASATTAPISNSVPKISISSLSANESNFDEGKTNDALFNKFLKNNFMAPTTGKNWGRLHGNNGVDIADGCGKNIYAADEGMVTESVANGNWNSGYGNYLVIKHPNGVSTKYAHTKKNSVKVGSYVLQGDPVALIGNTGFVHGITGCHLHFEVLGAKNPFARQ